MKKTPDEKTLPPILKWAGGKRWLVPELKKIWANYSDRTLVEPFCGGLAITLGLNPKTAILNDSNSHLINFYHLIQNNILRKPLIEMQNEKELYYSNRDFFNRLIEQLSVYPDLERMSWLFYYLNRTGFNGLCRFNRKGEYNVPFGSYKTINYQTDFSAYTSAFKLWHFYSCDFEDIDVPEDGFIYADPPYDKSFSKYAKDDFKWDDQIRLAYWLAEQSVPVVASNLATDRIIELYDNLGFSIQKIEAPRRISCNGNRVPAIEILATLNVGG